MSSPYAVYGIYGVYAAYATSLAAAWWNPADAEPFAVSWSVQAASIATLLILAVVSGVSGGTFKNVRTFQTPTTALLAVFSAALAGRVAASAVVDSDNVWMVRWDSFMRVVSMGMVTGLLAYRVGGWTLATAAVVVGLPALISAPRISRNRALLLRERPMLRAAIEFASKAYQVHGEGDNEYINDTATGTLAGVASRDGDVYVFFSGSQSWTDWVRVNADLQLVPYSSATIATPTATLATPAATPATPAATAAKVHRGFARAYGAVRDRVMTRLQDAMLRSGGARRVVVCGHSLGGSLATLAAMDIVGSFDAEDRPKVACVTFGAAQVGDQAFVDAFDASVPLSVRVVSVYDPVPKAFSAQLRHVGGEVVVASVPALPMAHSIQTYRLGIEQDMRVTVTVVLIPVIALIVMGRYARYGRGLP